jgi:hypothetical protein
MYTCRNWLNGYTYKTENTYFTRSATDRNENPTALHMFVRCALRKKLTSTVADFNRLKMGAAKPEMLLSRAL